MVKQTTPLNAPYLCYITLTNKCNLRCLHCLGDYKEACENELKFNEWIKIIDDLINMNVFYLNISGGEPTQHPDFDKILDYLTYRGMHFIITTNGVLSKAALDCILRNREYLIGIKISLDGYDAKTHCAIRRGKNLEFNEKIFEQTIKTIEVIKKECIPLTIATVIHSENIANFNQFIEFIKKINPISWFISPIIPSGRGNYAKELTKGYDYFDKGFWKQIVERCNIKKINVKLVDLPYDMSETKQLDYYECGAALTFCEINADGTVSPCTLCRTCIPQEKMAFENLRESSFKEIWDGNTFKEVRQFMTEGCTGCKTFSKCTKCIAQSFRYFGNGISPTPYCINNGINLGIKDLEGYNSILKMGSNQV